MPDSTTSRASLTLASTDESINTVERTAEDFAERAGFDPDTVHSVVSAVREAAINAVVHGNAYSAEKQVAAAFEITSDALTIRIADQGPGLDPNSLPDPLAPENLLRPSGRGIFLIRDFIDEVYFRKLRPGTEIVLIQHRPPALPTD